jgi:hypothetical protein
MLNFSSNVQNRLQEKIPRLKRFEQVWTREDNHHQEVKNAWAMSQGNLTNRLQHTLEALHRWGHNIFGTLPRKIKQSQDELMNLNQKHGIQDLTQAIKEKKIELDKLLDGEEMWWK